MLSLMTLGCTSLLDVDGDFEGSGGSGALTSGGAGGDGGTGGSGGSSAQGGGAGLEQCDNGLDDDGDTKVDCADKKCQALGYSCQPNSPSGWIEPVLWHEAGSPGDSCPAGWDNELFSGGEQAAKTTGSCPSCSCSTPSSTLCGQKVKFFKQANCSGTSKDDVIISTGEACKAVVDPFKPLSVRATSGYIEAQSNCKAQTGTDKLDLAKWKVDVKLCSPPPGGGGCKTGESCQPPPKASSCRAHVGDVACPASHANKKLLYQKLQDKRLCSACACLPSGAACSYVDLIYFGDSTTGCPNKKLLTSNCLNIAVDPKTGHYRTNTWFASGPKKPCKPSGGVLSGSIDLAEPVTVCCAP